MLNRTDLTSQGAKARRLLLKAMIEHGAVPGLDLDGHGPEVAMYRAFLERTGLHGHDARNEAIISANPPTHRYGKPGESSRTNSNAPKPRRINLRDNYAVLLLPR